MEAAEAWQQHRRYLFAVAYRMLGTAAEAEDAVSETYLRAQAGWSDAIQDPRAWLTAVVSRICLDVLKSARVQREAYVGPWLPEPLINYDDTDLGDQLALRESMRTPVLLVMERLTPAERVAFVLHDAFGMDYPRLAELLARTAAACRQLVSRARRAIRSEAPPLTEVSPADHQRALSALWAASSTGDVEGLVAALDPDIVLRQDGGGVVKAARRLVHGAEEVAKLLAGLGRLYPGMEQRPAMVSGSPGQLLINEGRLIGVVQFEITPNGLTAINFVLNPEKLTAARAALTGP